MLRAFSWCQRNVWMKLPELTMTAVPPSLVGSKRSCQASPFQLFSSPNQVADHPSIPKCSFQPCLWKKLFKFYLFLDMLGSSLLCLGFLLLWYTGFSSCSSRALEYSSPILNIRNLKKKCYHYKEEMSTWTKLTVLRLWSASRQLGCVGGLKRALPND